MKKERLKARGIRFTKLAWDSVKKIAKREKRLPSDIVRGAVDNYIYEKNER